MRELKKNIIDFMTEIRIKDYWNSVLWNQIYSELCIRVDEWKVTGTVPKSIVPFIADLVSELSGGNRFVDDATAAEIENGEIAILQLLYQLYDEDDDIIFNDEF